MGLPSTVTQHPVAGLISRKNRNFTSFGMIVYEAQLLIGRAVETFWKLKAIDCLEVGQKLPLDQLNKIVNALNPCETVLNYLIR